MKDWNNVITLLYEKTLQQSMVDKNINQKEAEEFKKIYNLYLDKKKRSTQFKVESSFGDSKSKDFNSPEKIAKLNNCLAKIM